MEYILWILAVNWAVMFTVPYSLFLVIICFPGVKYRGVKCLVPRASVNSESWISRNVFQRMSPHAFNFSLGLCVYFDSVYFQDDYNRTTFPFRKLEVHEMTHVKQQLYAGVFQWITYAIFYVIVGYENNPYEIQARNAEKGVVV